MMLMSAVVVVGLAVGAFVASKTTQSGPIVQSVAFAQGGASSSQGQGGGSRLGSNGSNQGSADGQSAGQTQGRGAAPLSGSVTSRDGNTLTVNTQQGDKKVNIAGAKFQKTVDGTTADLKAGETVIVTGQQGSDGVFTASTIQIRPESPAGGQGAVGG